MKNQIEYSQANTTNGLQQQDSLVQDSNNGYKTPLSNCRIMYFPKIHDPAGNLTFIEGGNHIPFDIARIYYLYDVPGGSSRGSHAHKDLNQVLVAMSGSFDVVLDDGTHQMRYHLNRSYSGLYICPMIWRRLENFSSGSVCLVMASKTYDEADYIRDYAEFKQLALCK
jgi:hypothetical protein